MENAPLSKLAQTVKGLSSEQWGEQGMVDTVGSDAALVRVQAKLARFARAERPVLITGESGVGKELFAKSLYLLSSRRGKPYLTINCAQYHEHNLITSELFGHTKGSFTGATQDRRGLFEEADGGVLFMDEVGELSARAQAMLLRTLSEGEIKPLGSNRVKHVNVRIIAATNQPLHHMVNQGTFRMDLFYRLRYLRLRIPPVRARGDDWRLLADFFLRRLAQQYGAAKRLSKAALSLLEQYRWPGNVREIRSVVHIGYHLAEGPVIERADVEEALEDRSGPAPPSLHLPNGEAVERYNRMLHDGLCFWEVVRQPFMDRDLNRQQVRAVVACGLKDTRGSYKKLLPIFRIEEDDYLRFMDFLRHHRLKPESSSANGKVGATSSNVR